MFCNTPMSPLPGSSLSRQRSYVLLLINDTFVYIDPDNAYACERSSQEKLHHFNMENYQEGIFNLGLNEVLL